MARKHRWDHDDNEDLIGDDNLSRGVYFLIMRKDMHKVLVERPRHVGRADDWSQVRSRLRDMPDEDLPAFVSMTRLHRDRKELNEFLTPLIAYLRSHVGERWDDIYSDICANLNRNSPVQLHIFQHLFDFVTLNVYIKNGRLYESDGTGLWGWRSRGSFYVGPDGILRETPRRTYKPYKDPNARIFVPDPKDQMIAYHQIEGIWYEVQFAKLPTLEDVRAKVYWKDGEKFRYDEYTYLLWDCLEHDRRSWRRLNQDFNGKRPISKMQLGKREIHRLRLNENLQKKAS